MINIRTDFQFPQQKVSGEEKAKANCFLKSFSSNKAINGGAVFSCALIALSSKVRK